MVVVYCQFLLRGGGRQWKSSQSSLWSSQDSNWVLIGKKSKLLVLHQSVQQNIWSLNFKSPYLQSITSSLHLSMLLWWFLINQTFLYCEIMQLNKVAECFFNVSLKEGVSLYTMACIVFPSFLRLNFCK